MGIKVMPITTAGKPKACIVNIEGDLIINNIKSIHSEMINMTCEKESVILNLGNVSSVDTAGLQFIWAIMKEAEKRKKTVEIHDVSPAVFEMAYESGIEMEKVLNFKREIING